MSPAHQDAYLAGYAEGFAAALEFLRLKEIEPDFERWNPLRHNAPTAKVPHDTVQ